MFLRKTYRSLFNFILRIIYIEQKPPTPAFSSFNLMKKVSSLILSSEFSILSIEKGSLPVNAIMLL